MSTELKHTPGPWLLQNETIYALDENGVVNRFSANVQEGYIRSSRNYMRNIRTPKAELKANACLIAASPELLAAAEQALNFFVGVPVLKEARECQAALEAAIAKATGQ